MNEELSTDTLPHCPTNIVTHIPASTSSQNASSLIESHQTVSSQQQSVAAPTQGQTTPTTIDDETLSRAVLTFCIDNADALLFATIKGAGDAATVLHLIAQSPSSVSDRRLDEAFATGTARWGRKVNSRGMNSFHLRLQHWRKRLSQLPSNDADALRRWLSADGTQWIIGPSSPYWPTHLNDLSIRKDWATPLCLWGIGDASALVSCSEPLAIVGSRGASDYGRYVAKTMSKKAAEQGHLVVSGGAFGIDAAAHAGALEAMDDIGESESGRTVAVFAGGLNHIGPERNRPLFNRIISGKGALISELCPDTIPEARRFLLRNRIIAAIASTVVVAQARSRSGALNTANWGAELGREIYAAPGDINIPSNTGCNRLIRDHRAGILTSVHNIEEIGHQRHAPQSASTGKNPISRHDESSIPATKPTNSQKEILTAIRSCSKKGVTATHEAILATLNTPHQTSNKQASKAYNTDRTPPEPWDVARLESELGEMELLGFIEPKSGTVHITAATCHRKHRQGNNEMKSEPKDCRI
jgi:DNA processing protein